MFRLDRLIRIEVVRPLDGLRVWLKFTDGTERVVDLEPYLHGPIYEPIRNNPEFFRTVSVDPRMKTIVWENGADIDPDVLYLGLSPAEIEEERELAL